MMIRVIVLSIIGLFFSTPLFGESFSQEELREILKEKIDDIYWLARHPLLVDATRKQNSKNLSLEKIKTLDKEWTSTKELTPFKKSLQEGKVGNFLMGLVHKKNVFNEIFLTDNQGANVSAYPATSDYWQGDEDKWKKAFNYGDGKLYVGPAEFDESTGTNAVQFSVPVLDEDKTIGVLVVGVKVSYIELQMMKNLKNTNRSISSGKQ